MNLKKILSVMLFGAMCVGFVACENNEPEEKNNQTTGQTNSNGNGSGSGSGGGTTNPTTQTYTVTVSANDATMGEVKGGGEYEEGAEVTLEATANEGYKFVKWSDENTENPRTITATADVTFTANFVLKEGYSVKNGYLAVDLGLPSGLLWATCNIGATKPEESGDYFAWGETTTKENYSWNSYKWGSYNYDDKINYGIAKYNKTDGKTILDPEDDAASVNWGGDWRMPTYAEQTELRTECTWTWTDNYNGTSKSGYIVSSKADDNGNSIFLPAAGFYEDSEYNNDYTYGKYWGASLSTDRGFTYILLFRPSGLITEEAYGRYIGHSVRAVCSVR